jgi:hypothetical protein
VEADDGLDGREEEEDVDHEDVPKNRRITTGFAAGLEA